ncbi:hypothetical protein ACFXOY_35765 [Streptomyces niveus]|uniref:hypothetical protein n=1 Tax=Streptomyces niveus TaxID=193462 RepID=UPI0036B7DBBA
MRTRIKLTTDGDSFVVRLTPSQREAMCRSLELLASRDFTDTAITLQLGVDREEIATLIEHLSGNQDASQDIRLRARDLHALHSALTAAATMFVERGGSFSEEAFYHRLGFFRENFDSLALNIVETASQATRTV